MGCGRGVVSEIGGDGWGEVGRLKLPCLDCSASAGTMFLTKTYEVRSIVDGDD
jgi:hypothetical protein